MMYIPRLRKEEYGIISNLMNKVWDIWSYMIYYTLTIIAAFFGESQVLSIMDMWDGIALGSFE